MSAWSWDDVQRSEPPAPAPAKGAAVRVALTPAEAAQLDDIAGGDCSRTEIARRLLVAVLEDDAAAHAGGSS